MKFTFLLITAGSHGDVFPFIGVGTRLVAAGHRAILVTAEPYRAAALENGLDFEPLMSRQQLSALLDHPDVWHPRKSAFVGAKFGRESLAQNYEILARLAAGPNTVMVAYPAVLAARLVHEKFKVPLISVVSMPWMIPSAVAPPLLSIGVHFSASWPLWIRKGYGRLLHGVGDFFLGRHLNRFRLTIELRPVRKVFQWWFSPQRVIALFPEWFAAPASDWPPNLVCPGFPLFATGQEPPLATELAEFCLRGDPPVVLTFGTGMSQGRKIFAEAIAACGKAGCRALVVTTHPEQLPDPLPPFAKYWDYAPFNRLFPLCGAVVHHGGIGTCSQALAAGTPQLILPMAWDQPDNARRIDNLGAGKGLLGAPNANRIASALTEVLSAATKMRCRELVRSFENTGGLEVAAGCIMAEARRMPPCS